MDPGALDLVDTQRHLAVVQQQNVVLLHIIVQIFVGDTNAIDVTIKFADGRIQKKRVSPLQSHTVIFETPDTNFGALQIANYTDEASALRGRLPQEQQSLFLLFVIAMGEIKTRHIKTGDDHIVQRLRVVRGWPERCDYLCSA